MMEKSFTTDFFLVLRFPFHEHTHTSPLNIMSHSRPSHPHPGPSRLCSSVQLRVVALVLIVCALLGRADAAAVAGEPWCAASPPASTSTASSPAVSTMRRKALPAEFAQSAVCMDGSPAVYYDNDDTSEPDCLIVYMQQGGYCADVETCIEEMRSSTYFPDTFEPLFLLGASHPQLHCCRRIYIPYCSKDLYVGQRVEIQVHNITTGANSTIFFRGKVILDAIIHTLNNTRLVSGAESESNVVLPPIAAYPRVLLAGSSAGGLGAAVHANNLRDRLWPAEGQLRLLTDSGWFTEVPANPDARDVLPSMEAEMVAGIALWKADANVQSLCSLSPLSNCFKLEFLTRTHTIPALHLVSAFDLYYTSRQDIDFDEVGPGLLSALQNQAGATRLSAVTAIQHWSEHTHRHSRVVVASCLQHMYHYPGPEDFALIDEAYDVPTLPAPETAFAIHTTRDSRVHYDNLFKTWLQGSSSDIPGHFAMPLTDYCLGFSCNPTCPLDALDFFPEVADRTTDVETRAAWTIAGVIIILAVLVQAAALTFGSVHFRRLDKAISAINVSNDLGLQNIPAEERITIFFRHIYYWPTALAHSSVEDNPAIRKVYSSTGEVKLHVQAKTLLKDLSGVLQAGQLTAIMGPSGCGKTTLLDVLSGRRQHGTVAGWLRVSGSQKKPLQELVSYVENHDIFYDALTVKETLMFQLLLNESHRRKDTHSDTELAERFWAVVNELGMAKTVNVRMGMCSSGQRRRISVALATLQDRPVLFLDEPTSGKGRMR